MAGLPWGAMFILVILGIGILYRYGPNVKTPRTPVFTWGAVFAAFLWAVASVAFSAYLSSFNSYNRIYGSIGTVVAGNVGTAERYEYTIIGDPVNEAARLTDLAKQRSGRVMASAAVLQSAGADEAKHWHEAGEETLRGRDRPTRVVEPR